MKRFTRTLLLITVLAVAIAGTASAKDFKGIITYKISYPGSELDAQTKAMLPKMLTYKIKGNLAKTEMEMGGMGRQMQIINGDEKVVYTLIDMMGKKITFKMTEEEINKELENEPNVTVDYFDETKEIAGYECKKAVINMDNDGTKSSFIVYYTDELGGQSLNFDNNMFKEIDGVLMEFEIIEGNMKMKMEAVSVKKENVPDSEFVVPDDFEEMTKEEMQNMFGGGM
ncbi:MAG: DUF4412 domain-containing protein [Bacteroidota bacterium]|nr:DUF4412 domain-containing protein [Bacteroidota bacterium]